MYIYDKYILKIYVTYFQVAQRQDVKEALKKCISVLQAAVLLGLLYICYTFVINIHLLFFSIEKSMCLRH